MNIVKIIGGLGNQMFQYAFGRAMEEPAAYDNTWYLTDHEHPRTYTLDKFNTQITLYPFIRGQHLTNERVHKNDIGFDLNLNVLKQKDTNYYGYWQHMAYYKDILPRLRKELTVKKEFYTIAFLELKRKIVNCESVAIHVRRTDYLYQKGFWNLDMDYYDKAWLLCNKGEHLFIFSDDIPWCKTYFKEDYFINPITFVNLKEDYLEFELLKLCKHKIIANSTFSYWAAILSNHPDQIIIAPSGWITGARELDQKERMKLVDSTYYPAEWIKI
jgi:hypothetical protein